MRDWRETRVLIAGCGSIGRRHARVLQTLGIANLEITDPNPAQRKALQQEVKVKGEYENYLDALSARPDVVFICTPADLHIPLAVQALERGIAVFCEKPLSYTKRGIDNLVAVLEKTKLPFAVGFCFRYHEALTEAKKLLSQGVIGEVKTLRLRMSENLSVVRPDYRNLATLVTGGVYDLTHEIDLAFWFAGKEAKVADLQILDGIASDLGFQRPDFSFLSMKFTNRICAQIYLDYFSVPRTRVTEIMGTEGTLRLEFADWNVAELALFRKDRSEWQVHRIPTARDTMFRLEDEEFLRFASGENVFPACPLEEAMKSLEVLDRALKRYTETVVS